MANDNNNSNELVAQAHDAAAEAAATTIERPFGKAQASNEAESNQKTFDLGEGDAEQAVIEKLRHDLEHRSRTIERLQFDIEKLHSRWLGLEAEIEARESLTVDLHEELRGARQRLKDQRKQLGERDRRIESLEQTVREREREVSSGQRSPAAREDGRSLHRTMVELDEAKKKIAEYEGHLANQQAQIVDLRAQQERTEGYADRLRRQLADLVSETQVALADTKRLGAELEQAESRSGELERALEEERSRSRASESALESMRDEHEKEIRLLRLELGEAAETLAEHETISEQLASDLVDTRSYKEQLELMLNTTEERSQAYIEKLELKITQLEDIIADYENKLDRKSKAIESLIAEMTKKNSDLDSIGEIGHMISNINSGMSERSDRRDEAPESGERVARMLVGRIDKQELRFPLFKNRLTIGRTRENDIQLKAQFISRRHAVLVTEGSRARLIDWGSRNGVYVNSNRITEHFLRHGDIVRIGNAKFRYEERVKRDA